ncbi:MULTISPECIES: VOC family protein [unclassified Fusibacter]|uniref:VOC family protein n=1 Tax=unclassified Fusibacter TaxID=2624464 RepID=UPI0013E918A7|nr:MULTISPECIES: VOC family protein [unclassified Fusibacter]MCK8058167.1 VOC family protein [Fusibacter sp. A2]NPE20750.1 VOC family protein [Fusibacter sp. A1]
MLNLGSTYLIVKDMEQSIAFYEALLQMKASVLRYDRWTEFNFSGHCIALLNPKYDEELIDSKSDVQVHYNRAYIEHLRRKTVYGNNIVLNFYIDDLNEEYKRIKELNIGKLSDIMYINISSPYYHFIVDDPDGNTIEITGSYTEQ